MQKQILKTNTKTNKKRHTETDIKILQKEIRKYITTQTEQIQNKKKTQKQL